MGEFYVLIGLVLEVVAALKYNLTDVWRLAYLIGGSVFIVGGSIIRRIEQ